MLTLAAALLVLGSAALVVYAASAGQARRPARARLALAASLNRPLRPGASARLNLVLTNRYRFAVSVTRVKVSLTVRPRRRGARCSARRDFVVTQLPRRAYTIRLPARSRRSLTRLRVRSRFLPRLAMRDLRHTNQDDCQRAALRLRYSARLRRAPRARSSR
jgi:hypothetical protein